MERVVEGSKTFLKNLATKLIEDAPTAPVLIQYSCDCTPLVSRSRQTTRHGTFVAQSSGPSSLELFVQHVFVSVGGAGDRPASQTIVFKEPLKLLHGKTMPALLACSLRSPGCLLGCGPRQGVVFRHQVHDRAMTEKFAAALAGHWAQATQTSSQSGMSSSSISAAFVLIASSCTCTATVDVPYMTPTMRFAGLTTRSLGRTWLSKSLCMWPWPRSDSASIHVLDALARG